MNEKYGKAEVVICVRCGERLQRLPLKPENGRPVYRWYSLDGQIAARCPGCGAATSLGTTVTAGTAAKLEEAVTLFKSLTPEAQTEALGRLIARLGAPVARPLRQGA